MADDDDLPDLSRITLAYKRALWAVVVLNIGYGAVEIAGGFFARSQALKADALDFMGDGLITTLGLVAVNWGLAARARAALLQGIFLALLGIGVIGNTLYRVFVMQQPEVIIALAVNIVAALLLFRTGRAMPTCAPSGFSAAMTRSAIWPLSLRRGW